jgi:hypothetical protein
MFRLLVVLRLDRSRERPMRRCYTTSAGPLVPAFVAVFSVTVTVAVAFAQGATPVTVYTYAPGVIVAGS